MSPVEILSLVVTFICVGSFSIVFTVLFKSHYKNQIKEIKEGKLDIELIDNALYEDKIERSKTRKTLRIISKVISYTLLGVVVSAFGLSLFSRITGNLMPIGDQTMVVISTGSMSKKHEANTYLEANNLDNQIQSYDMVGIKKVDPSKDLKLYDVIAFKADDGRIIVHRIIEVVVNGFLTRGDASKNDDAGVLYKTYLPYDRIVGQYTGVRIPLIGLFVIFLQSNSGIITVVCVVYCLLMFDHLRSKYENAIIERTNMLIDLIECDIDSVKTEDIITSYNEVLIYQGQEYHFEAGKFIKKQESKQKYEDDQMVFIKDKGDEVKTTIKTVDVVKENLESKEADKS